MDDRTFATHVARLILDDEPDGDALVAIICSDNELQQEAWTRLCRMRADTVELKQIVMFGKGETTEWAADALLYREDCGQDGLALIAAKVPGLRGVAWERLQQDKGDCTALKAILKHLMFGTMVNNAQ